MGEAGHAVAMGGSGYPNVVVFFSWTESRKFWNVHEYFSPTN